MNFLVKSISVCCGVPSQNWRKIRRFDCNFRWAIYFRPWPFAEQSQAIRTPRLLMDHNFVVTSKAHHKHKFLCRTPFVWLVCFFVSLIGFEIVFDPWHDKHKTGKQVSSKEPQILSRMNTKKHTKFFEVLFKMQTVLVCVCDMSTSLHHTWNRRVPVRVQWLTIEHNGSLISC
jgi:hypothetical protein